LLQNVAHLPAHSAIFWELMIVDAAGVVHEGNAPLARVHAVANAPMFSYDESFFGREIVGGPLLQVADTSRQAAAVAVRILGGERASDIKIPPVQFGPPMFDWRQMQRWGISEHALPPGSEIHFRDPTVWDRYRLHILAICAVLVMQGALIAWLIYEHLRRRIAEAESLQRMNDLARINRFATAGELSASIAHEIRQPLAAIAAAGYTGLNWLKHKTPNVEEACSALQAVVDESHRADHVIEGMRAVFRREAAVRVEVDLNRLVQQVLLLTARVIKSNDIVLQTALTGEPIPLVMADPVQLQQVILNLIMNAVEAMAASDDATKTLRIETGTDQAGRVFLTVEDSGPGFDAKVADNLFKPFVTTKPNGMGMGLSICKTIIGQHGGELSASAVKPQGVMFRIVLPPAKKI
jgi:signal transduction histidine kinase